MHEFFEPILFFDPPSIYKNLYVEEEIQPQQMLLPYTSNSLKKWNSTDSGKQKELTDAIVTFVAQDLQPLAIVESPAFRRVLEMAEPRYTMPSRKHLSNQLIPKRYTRLFSTTVALLKKAPQICVTLDMWTNRQMHSYFGMPTKIGVHANIDVC